MDNDQMSDLLVNNIDVSEEIADASWVIIEIWVVATCIRQTYETINEYISKQIL